MQDGGVVPVVRDPELLRTSASVRAWIRTIGFELISDAIYRAPIRGVALELSEPEHLTIGKCLFEDFDES